MKLLKVTFSYVEKNPSNYIKWDYYNVWYSLYNNNHNYNYTNKYDNLASIID